MHGVSHTDTPKYKIALLKNRQTEYRSVNQENLPKIIAKKCNYLVFFTVFCVATLYFGKYVSHYMCVRLPKHLSITVYIISCFFFKITFI